MCGQTRKLTGSFASGSHACTSRQASKQAGKPDIPFCLSISAASSADALGITPGSLNDVLNKVAITKINKAPPIAGMAGVTCSARYTQLGRRRNRERGIKQ